jgi:hypothetical protein
METNVKAVVHRHTPPSWRLILDTHNPLDLGKSAPGRLDECPGLSSFQFPVPAEPLAWNQPEIANCHFGSFSDLSGAGRKSSFI